MDKLMQRLRFFMDLSGNKDLLDRGLVAFFASRKATPHDTQLALQWAESICQTDKVVISGFHSPLEKEILNYLLERHRPVIFALGRALYKKVPPHLQTAFDEGNLLFVSFRDYTRHSWNSTYNATGAPPTSPPRSFSPNSTTLVPSAPCISPSIGIAIRQCMF